MNTTIYICQGKSCKRNDSEQLLSFLEQEEFSHIVVKTQYCFGKCGNGCVIFSTAEERFYTYVNTNNIQTIIDRALGANVVNEENP